MNKRLVILLALHQVFLVSMTSESNRYKNVWILQILHFSALFAISLKIKALILKKKLCLYVFTLQRPFTVKNTALSLT